jgi:hypothetical protein
MIERQIDLISRSDIEALLSSPRTEDRRIEYKQQLPSSSDDDKREFLADISSFANGVGGDLVYGIAESSGVPTSITGVPVQDFDALRLRLQNIIRDGIQPRIPSVDLRAVEGFPNGSVIIIRVHDSWLGPHMVVFKGSSRFFVRDAAQRHQMDVQELRTAFIGSGALAERVRAFRNDRLAKLISADTPVPTWPHPTIALHVVPLGRAFSTAEVDPRVVGDLWRPLMATDFVVPANQRINLDGFLIYATPLAPPDPSSESYIQLFRNGAVEAVTTLTREAQPFDRLVAGDFEAQIVTLAEALHKFRRDLGLADAAILFLSLLRFRGVALYPANPYVSHGRQIDRSEILLPDILVEGPVPDFGRLLKPAFDILWQAAGYSGSRHYDQNGIWQRPNRD